MEGHLGLMPFSLFSVSYRFELSHVDLKIGGVDSNIRF